MSMKKNYVVETIRREQLLRLLAGGKRLDGRAPDEYRPLFIETGVIQKANGSARVKLGDTEIVVGVKIATGVPFPDTPDKGLLVVNGEILPLASPYAEPGPPSEDVVELARVVDRGVRESEMVDLQKLCLIPGKSVITAFADVNVMNVDGNLFDAASYGVVAALRTSKMKKYTVEGDKVTAGDEWVPLPVEKTPVSVTMARIGDYMVADPNGEEEASMDMRITIATDDDGNICASQKGEASTITPKMVLEAADASIRLGKQIRRKIQESSS